jgi:hypothetical protein
LSSSAITRLVASDGIARHDGYRWRLRAAIDPAGETRRHAFTKPDTGRIDDGDVRATG